MNDLERLIAGTQPDAPEGPGNVSVDRAIRTGRRTVRNRRAAGALAAVAAVLAIVLVPAVIGSQLGSEQHPVAPPSVTPKPFGLWVQEFQAGIAGGFRPATYETGLYEQTITLGPESLSSPVRGVIARVRLWPAGRSFSYAGSTQPPSPYTGPDAARLPDHKAYILHSDAARLVLAWQRADGGWGFVELSGHMAGSEDASATVARVIHIAESVQPARRPIAVPFTVRGSSLPDNWISGVITEQDTRAVMLRLAGLTVGVRPSAAPVKTNTTVGGRPAYKTSTMVEIPRIGPGYNAVASVGRPGAIAVAERAAAAITLVGNPDDKSAWTTLPIH